MLLFKENFFFLYSFLTQSWTLPLVAIAHQTWCEEVLFPASSVETWRISLFCANSLFCLNLFLHFFFANISKRPLRCRIYSDDLLGLAVSFYLPEISLCNSIINLQSVLLPQLICFLWLLIVFAYGALISFKQLTLSFTTLMIHILGAFFPPLPLAISSV